MVQYTYVLNNPVRYIDPWGLFLSSAVASVVYTVVAVAVYVALSLASPPTPPSFDSITEEVWYFMDSMTNKELRDAISTGLFEAMGVHIPSDVIKAIASGGHIDMNELRQDLVGWVVDAIIEDSSGLGIGLLDGWGYVPGNSWHRDASSSDRTINIPEKVLQAANQGVQSFILYDPRTFDFSINRHINNISRALENLYGGTVTRIQTVRWRAETFEEWWNSLSGDIGAIVTFGHAASSRLQLDSRNDVGRRGVYDRDPQYDFGINSDQIRNLVTLNPLTVDMMVLLGCNPGLVSDGGSIAMEFARNVNGIVFAPNGQLMVTTENVFGGMFHVANEGHHFIAHSTGVLGQVQRSYAIDATLLRRPASYITRMYDWVREQPTIGLPINNFV